jgi:hypothetical protein
MRKTSTGLRYQPLSTEQRLNNKCERCFVTYGPDNAICPTMKLESMLVPGKFRYLCERHFTSLVMGLGDY